MNERKRVRRYVADGVQVLDTRDGDVASAHRTSELAKRVARFLNDYEPRPERVINGHGLFVAEVATGNMGAPVPVFQAFCTCGRMGSRNTSKEGVLALWTRHAEHSSPGPSA